MKTKALFLSLAVAITGCAGKPATPAKPLTPEQLQALEDQRKANEELLRKNNEAYQKAKADHPESFSH